MILLTSDLERFAGPLIIGCLINWAMFGVLSVQVYLYHIAFPEDRTVFKALVYGTFILEITQTLLFGYTAFKTFVTGFGDLAGLDEVDIIWFSVPVLTGLVAFLAQAFYAYRVTVLAQTKCLGVIVLLLACLQLGGAIGTGVQAENLQVWGRSKVTRVIVTLGLWQAGSAACDILIAASMTYYLKRRDTGIKQTQVLLARLIRLTIETGTMSAAIAVISLVLTLAPGRSRYCQASCSALAKVYSNSMMVAFNSRMKISPSNASSSISMPLSQLSWTRSAEMRDDVDINDRHGGVLIATEHISFAPNVDLLQPEKVFKRLL